jgi:excisionase family DNA binding protein
MSGEALSYIRRSCPKEKMKLLTIKEVCSCLSISRSKLYDLFRSGQLMQVRIGKRGVRISEAEIARFIESVSVCEHE